MKLLHDNARPHTASKTANFISSQGVLEIDHPPYSPDLSACDNWLFDYMKRNLGDETSVESLTKSVTTLLNETPKNEYRETKSTVNPHI